MKGCSLSLVSSDLLPDVAKKLSMAVQSIDNNTSSCHELEM